MSHELMTGTLWFAYGSPVEEASRGIDDLAGKIEAVPPYRHVRAAFLDGPPPDLLAGVMEAAEAGPRWRRDLPKLVAATKVRRPNFEIAAGQSLEGYPLTPSIILGRVQEALRGERAS